MGQVKAGFFLHNTAACKSMDAVVARKTGIIIETHIRIIFIAAPFLQLKKPPRILAVRKFRNHTSRTTLRSFGYPCFIIAAPRPLSGDNRRGKRLIYFLDINATAPLDVEASYSPEPKSLWIRILL
jgi:hypothetical protein